MAYNQLLILDRGRGPPTRYLPDRDTLARAVQDGATHMYIDDTFVVASGWDEENKRYRGVRVGGGTAPV